MLRSVSFFRKGWQRLRRGEIGVEVLDASAVGGSILSGNFNTASSVMFLLGISELLESYTLKKTKSMLRDSLLVNADTVWIEKGDEVRQIPLSEVAVGDVLVVRTGAMIPIDGTVRSGEALR